MRLDFPSRLYVSIRNRKHYLLPLSTRLVSFINISTLKHLLLFLQLNLITLVFFTYLLTKKKIFCRSFLFLSLSFLHKCLVLRCKFWICHLNLAPYILSRRVALLRSTLHHKSFVYLSLRSELFLEGPTC